MKDRKRQNESRMANLKKGSEIDMKVLLANVGNHSGKLLELVYMNHTSTAKARKAVKKQKEIGFEKTRREFGKLLRELAHEKNFCYIKTIWEPKGRKGQTRKYYSYQPLDPGFNTTQPVEEDTHQYFEGSHLGFQEVKVHEVLWEEAEGKDEIFNSSAHSD